MNNILAHEILESVTLIRLYMGYTVNNVVVYWIDIQSYFCVVKWRHYFVDNVMSLLCGQRDVITLWAM